MTTSLLWSLLAGWSEEAALLKGLHSETYLDGKLVQTVPLKPQKYSNCSWASNIVPAIAVAYQLKVNPDGIIRNGRFDPEVLTQMKAFTRKAKAIAVDEYILDHRSALSESVGYPDVELTGKTLLYFLHKCACRPGDPVYLNSLDSLVHSGLAIAPATLQMHGYSPQDKMAMLQFLDNHYSLAGFRDYLKALGCRDMDDLSDGEAFLYYLSYPAPLLGSWPQFLLR